jgi:hypothetical protein
MFLYLISPATIDIENKILKKYFPVDPILTTSYLKTTVKLTPETSCILNIFQSMDNAMYFLSDHGVVLVIWLGYLKSI